uniref:Complement factor H n=1 Tax=Mastacembelus armatus TaxID=205130 RepID=A0A3Q3M9G9_9TELE
MHIITKSCVLFVWMHTLTFVKSQGCTLEQFLNSDLYDRHFDVSELEPSYAAGKQVRVACSIGFSGFFKLQCIEGKWQSKGTKCQPRSCGHPGDAQFADFQLQMGDDFVFGSKVVYTCHKGYQMVSRSNVRRCMAEGWDGVVPVCEAQQCPVIHVDNNVQVTGDPEEATFGNVLRFSCKSSSEILDGSAEAYCDEHGQWSSQPPKCKEIKCPAPVIDHGNVRQAKTEYKEHEILYFDCKHTYKRSDDRPSKCTKVGIRAEWIPTPTCEMVKCRLPQVSSEGTKFQPQKNVFYPGESVQVICTERHWIINKKITSQETTCDDNGEWTVDPLCREVTCSNEKEMGVYSWSVGWNEKITLDRTVNYRCRSGYRKPDGITDAKCTRNEWFPNPLCEGKDRRQYTELNTRCLLLTNVFISTIYCIYECTDGYKGSGIVDCRENGFTGSRECKGCRKPEFPNGFVVGPINETLYFACREGYKLLSQGWWGEAKCDETLSGLQCIEKTSCGPVPMIPNGQVRSQENHYRQGELVQITCDEGYTAVNNLTCNKGKWEAGGSLKTVCTPAAQPCSPPPRVDNAVVMTQYKKQYLSETQVTYQCRHGYNIDGEDTIKCQDGKWETKSIKCLQYQPSHVIHFICETGYISGQPIRYECTSKVKPCELPEDIEHGHYEIIRGEEFVFGTTIQYFCNEGYYMGTKENTRTCLQENWTNRAPRCEPVSCDPPPVDGEVKVKNLPENDNPILPDRFLTFSCDVPGKKLNGTSVLYCGKDGQWDYPFPTCEEIVCSVNKMHPHLRANGLPPGNTTVKIGHKLQFLCDGDYTRDGPQEIECLSTGQWSAPLPTCNKKCKVPSLPRGVYITPRAPGGQLSKGQTLKFACTNNKHFLHGNATIQCSANGQWNDSVPTCGLPLDCGSPPPLTDGDVTGTFKFSYKHKEKVEYSCQNFYIMEGDRYRVCNNGQWTGNMKCLKPCTIDEELMKQHNIAFRYSYEKKLYSPHGDEIEFMCIAGRHVGTVGMRQRCNNGVMQLPTCQ